MRRGQIPSMWNFCQVPTPFRGCCPGSRLTPQTGWGYLSALRHFPSWEGLPFVSAQLPHSCWKVPGAPTLGLHPPVDMSSNWTQSIKVKAPKEQSQNLTFFLMGQVKYANNFPDIQSRWKVFWKVFQICLWSQSKKFKVESSELAYVSPPFSLWRYEFYLLKCWPSLKMHAVF